MSWQAAGLSSQEAAMSAETDPLRHYLQSAADILHWAGLRLHSPDGFAEPPPFNPNEFAKLRAKCLRAVATHGPSEIAHMASILDHIRIVVDPWHYEQVISEALHPLVDIVNTLDAREDGHLELLPTGFAYKSNKYDLAGRPRQMLEALLRSPYRRLSVNELRRDLQINDESVEHPDQVIKDAATDLRKALRKAIEDAGLECEDPLPSRGQRDLLAYLLNIP
jgi:hypothetical protein